MLFLFRSSRPKGSNHRTKMRKGTLPTPVRHRVLDPFCGTGTTLVECKKQGIPSEGLESNPVVHFAACTKTNWAVSPSGLETHAQETAAAVHDMLRSAHCQVPDAGPLYAHAASEATPLRRLSPEQERLLIANSISPVPLHKALVLRDRIPREPPYGDHERLAYAKQLVSAISNLRFGPEVGVGRIKADAPVVELWLAEVRHMAADLRQTQMHSGIPAIVHRADARQADTVLPPESIDAVITSPPYPNEKDYSRTTRLESVMLDFLRDRTDLRAQKSWSLRSNTRNVYKGDADDAWIADNPRVQTLAATIEARRRELGKTSGFEKLYARVVQLYFGGMARHLACLRPLLRPGARLAYVVGDQASYFRIPIRTGAILAEIAVSLGYELEAIDLFRTRFSTATQIHLREEVVVLHWQPSRAP